MSKKLFRNNNDLTKQEQGLPRSSPARHICGLPSPSFEKSKIQFLKPRAGFSLLEMIIAIGIFLTAFTIILGALVSVNDAARKTRSERIVADNLSAAIDSMSRSVRVGTRFHCSCGGTFTTPQDCPMTNTAGDGGGACLAFEGQFGDTGNSGDQIVYRLNGGSIERSTNSGATYFPLTAPELHMTNLKFYVYGTAPGVDQPVITMIVRGTASTTVRTATAFDVETTVSAYTPNL